MSERRFTAWSYSRLSQWETCAAQAAYKHLDKLKEEASPAMARGDQIHKAAAAFFQSQGPMPQEAAKFAGLFAEVLSCPVRVVEQQWGFNSSWRATGWFDKAAWVRVVLDLGVIYPDNTADVIDHKTGKEYANNADQRELNGLAMLCRYPELSHVTSRMWYLDSGHETVCEIDQADRTDLIQKWSERAAPMLADTLFAPRPGTHCARCSYSRSKGGPCKFG